jgi:hypothetical protein
MQADNRQKMHLSRQPPPKINIILSHPGGRLTGALLARNNFAARAEARSRPVGTIQLVVLSAYTTADQTNIYY